MNFDVAYLVSDLHLGGERGQQMFSSAKAFKDFCKVIASEVKKGDATLLLVNGDFVDFLAEKGASYWNGAHAASQLRGMSQRSGLKLVFDGLKHFVSKEGTRLVFVLGNHDIELALPDVREELVRLLTGGQERRQARVEFAMDGWGYRFEVGAARALATHGNEVDPFNFTRYDILSQIIHEQTYFGESQVAKKWKPSAGSAFVVDAINPLKRQFPFVDLLKPESVSFLTLTMLAPKSLAMADEFVSLLADAKRNEASRPSSQRRFLSGGDPDSQITNAKKSATVLEAMANRHVRYDQLEIDDLILSGEDGLLGVADWVDAARESVAGLYREGIQWVEQAGRWVISEATDSARRVHSEALRKAIAPFIASESFHVSRLGDPDRQVLKMIRGSYDAVFTGHTHVRRFCEDPERNMTLVNTGTWAGLLQLSDSDIASATEFGAFYRLLSKESRSALKSSRWYRDECPVAVMRKLSQTKTELRLARFDPANRAIDPQDHLGREYSKTISPSKDNQ